MKPQIGISDDYAAMSFAGNSFYYGYEHSLCGECGKRNKGEYCDDHEDADSIWCFVAALKESDEIVIPYTKLGADKFDVVDNLLIGMGWLFAKYEFKKKPQFQTNEEWLKDYDNSK